MLTFIGMVFVYSLGIHITVIVIAFQESAGTGFLTLCLPFYSLYFVFKQCDNGILKLLYAIAVALNLTLKFLL
jgi:hypothetical protein